MKTLYYMARDYSDLANYGIIYSTDEYLREAFENVGLPQSIYIKDGKPYYIDYISVGLNRYLEFFERYDELAQHAFEDLHLPANDFTIYLHYFLKD